MKPTIGRIVHYTNLGDRDGRYPPETQAAIITKVVRRNPDSAKASDADESDYAVSLRIFYEMGDFAMVDVPFTAAVAGCEAARGRWAWPERA